MAGGRGWETTVHLLTVPSAPPGAAAPTLPAHPSTFTQVSQGPPRVGALGMEHSGRWVLFPGWGVAGKSGAAMEQKRAPQHCPWESSEDVGP